MLQDTTQDDECRRMLLATLFLGTLVAGAIIGFIYLILQ